MLTELLIVAAPFLVAAAAAGLGHEIGHLADDEKESN